MEQATQRSHVASIGYKAYITVLLEYLHYIGCGRNGQSSDLKTTLCYLIEQWATR